MNVITKRTILFYIEKYPVGANSLKSWYEEILKAEFRNFNELKTVYGNASIIANNRIVFNIKGNSFRLIVSVRFETQALYVIWFGPHSAYDNTDSATIKYINNPYKS